MIDHAARGSTNDKMVSTSRRRCGKSCINPSQSRTPMMCFVSLSHGVAEQISGQRERDARGKIILGLLADLVDGVIEGEFVAEYHRVVKVDGRSGVAFVI